MQCYLSVEDTGEVSLAPRPQLTCGQTSLEVRDVTLKVDQGLVVLLYVGLRAVGMVVVLSWPAVPHDHVKNCLAMMKLLLLVSFPQWLNCGSGMDPSSKESKKVWRHSII